MTIKNILILLLFLLSSCVSIGPKQAAPVPSKFIVYNPPPKSFIEKDWERMDKTWVHNKTGSTISYFSDCNPLLDPTLKELQEEVLLGVEDLKLLKSKSIKFNSRKALRAHYSGSVDGVNTEFDLLVFKKNSCVYILSYISLSKNFSFHQMSFTDFINSFSVKRDDS